MKTTPFSRLLATCCALGLATIAVSCGGSESEQKNDKNDPCGGKCTSTQVCDMGQCVQCTSDAHCQALDASLPRCRLSDNTCVQCTATPQCSGTNKVCQNNVCQTSSGPIDDTPVCTLGTCSPDGTAKCASATIGGKTYFDPCASGQCESGACVENTQECTLGQCYSGTAKCTSDGKISTCSGTKVCILNECQEPQANARCGDNVINQQSEACDGSDLGGKSCKTISVSGKVFDGGTLKCTSSCKFDTSNCTEVQDPPDQPSANGIASARNALKGAAYNVATAVNVAISNATVTYVHPNGSGYFLQEGATGPAIFVNKDGGSVSGTVAAGDVVSLKATEVKRYEVKRISKFENWTKVKSGTVNYTWRQDVSDAANVTDIDTYETELIDATMTLTGEFLGAGTGFKKASIKTDGYTPSTPSAAFVLRVPESMASTIESEAAKLNKKVTGCDVIIEGGFYWANDTDKYHDTQLSVYEDKSDDNFLVDCANAEDMPGGPGSDTGAYDYTEGFGGLPNTTGTGYEPEPPYTFTSNGISWEVKARTQMIESSTDYSIDGNGVILQNGRDAYIQASGLTKGVGKLAFTYKLWGSDSANTLTIEFFSGATSLGTKTASAPKTSTPADVVVNNINYSATSFKITSTGGKRIIIDDVRWTNK